MICSQWKHRSHVTAQDSSIIAAAESVRFSKSQASTGFARKRRLLYGLIKGEAFAGIVPARLADSVLFTITDFDANNAAISSFIS